MPALQNTLRSESFNFKTHPYQHQIESFEYAYHNDKFLLGDEQGLGKTKQAIDIAISKKEDYGVKHCLIVCGVNGLKFNWEREIKIHSDEKAKVIGKRVTRTGKVYPGNKAEKLEDLQAIEDGEVSEFFLITNIEFLRTKEIQERVRELTEKGIIDMVVFDEIHKAKNAESKQGLALHCLQPTVRLAMTGTPLMNQPIDLYNILKWLGVYHGTFYTFRSRFCTIGGRGGWAITGYKNLSDLRRMFEQVLLRRKKEDVVDLPPKIRKTEYLDMTNKQQQLYAEVRRCILANIHEIRISPNPLAQLIRLRQVTAHTSILSHTIGESSKLNRLKEILEELEANGEKAIIFSNWTDVTHILEEELAHYNPAIITGEVSDKEGEMDRFMEDDDCKVIIGTISAMGTGFTLTKATTVIFMDKPWNMANTEQAEDRAHRIGTTTPVTCITLACKDTIDQRIEEIIEEKGELAKALVEGDEEVINRLSIDTDTLVDRLLS